MSRPLVLVTRRLPSSVLAKLEQVCDVDLYVGAAAISREELLQRVAGKHAIVCLLTEPIDAAVLDAAGPQLKVVSNVAVGYNNIDLAACRSRGVVVTNTPDVLTNACADFTWGLILAITRRLGEGERSCVRAPGAAGHLTTCWAWSCEASNSASSVSAASDARWPPRRRRSA